MIKYLLNICITYDIGLMIYEFINIDGRWHHDMCGSIQYVGGKLICKRKYLWGHSLARCTVRCLTSLEQ